MKRKRTYLLLAALVCSTTILQAEVVDIPIAASSDDAEDNYLDGKIVLFSSDLEILTDDDGPRNQQVGLRFVNIPLPLGVTIKAAWVTFTAKGTRSDKVDLLICGEAADNPETFTRETDSISSRPRTSTLKWSIREEWVKGQAYRTPDISAIIQEIINRDGWKPGNALAIFLADGPFTLDRRNVYSYDHGDHAEHAPVLHIEYELKNRVG